jgi:hypothetical protein
LGLADHNTVAAYIASRNKCCLVRIHDPQLKVHYSAANETLSIKMQQFIRGELHGRHIHVCVTGHLTDKMVALYHVVEKTA